MLITNSTTIMPATGVVTLLGDDQVSIPINLDTLEKFRRWTRSETFPERGRIDYVRGRIEVSMPAEAMFSHGGVKAAIVCVLSSLIWDEELGEIRFDNMRIASVAADLSAEPDVLFLSDQTLASGRVRLIPKSKREDEFIEIEGGPDMVAEIVSDSSVVKDTEQLPASYFEAGVLEFWLVDARGEALVFVIHRRGKDAFEPVATESDGWLKSDVFGRRFRLTRAKGRTGNWKYDLEASP